MELGGKGTDVKPSSISFKLILQLIILAPKVKKEIVKFSWLEARPYIPTLKYIAKG